MSKKLFVELTDEVVKEILKHEVIMPSLYQEIFVKVAKEKGIDLEDTEKLKQFGSIELTLAKELMKKNREDMDTIYKCSNDAKEAIENQDTTKLNEISSRMLEVNKTITKQQNVVYKDPLTKLNNRIWINEKYLSDGKFANSGHLVYLLFDGVDETREKHGKVVCEKVTIYISSFLNKLYPEVELVKYSDKNFIYFLEGMERDELEDIFSDASAMLEAKKLKATDGEPLHLSFLHSIVEFNVDDHFRDVIEMSNSLIG